MSNEKLIIVAVVYISGAILSYGRANAITRKSIRILGRSGWDNAFILGFTLLSWAGFFAGFVDAQMGESFFKWGSKAE